MTLTYEKRNLDNIAKLADHTKAAALQWHAFLVKNNIDILIYETIRTIEQQKKNVQNGKSQTMKSYHLKGQALDFVPIVNGNDDWNAYGRPEIQKAIAEAKRLGFEWGGEWRGFVDKPHLQFNYKGYGTDTFIGNVPYKVIIPNTAYWQAKNLVIEFGNRGFKCQGVAGKTYKQGEQPSDKDPYAFEVFTTHEQAKYLVIEFHSRGYDRAYGEEIK